MTLDSLYDSVAEHLLRGNDRRPQPPNRERRTPMTPLEKLAAELKGPTP